jgi:hypothetical protein
VNVKGELQCHYFLNFFVKLTLLHAVLLLCFHAAGVEGGEGAGCQCHWQLYWHGSG